MADLKSMLNNVEWERYKYPFPYVYATDVFTPQVYEKLDTQFKTFIANGLSEGGSAAQPVLSRTMKGYDAYGLSLDRDNAGPFSVFLSTEWHDMLNNLFDIKGTGYINCGLHYHLEGSKTGWIHRDLNPVWFYTKGEGRIRCPNHVLCNYKNGHGPIPDNEKIQVVRGVVMLYYLNNDGWKPGDGGETGFFIENHPRRDWKPYGLPSLSIRKVPPINNSIVIYECNTKSYHTFLSNVRNTRSCLIMWTHRSMEDAQEAFRWPDDFEMWND